MARFGAPQQAPLQSSDCDVRKSASDVIRTSEPCSSGSQQHRDETYGTLPLHSKALSKDHFKRRFKKLRCRFDPAELSETDLTICTKQAGVATRAATNLMCGSSAPCSSDTSLRHLSDRDIDVPGDSCTNPDAEELTLLYDGNFNVYNNVTLAQFQEIMLVAAGMDSCAKNASSMAFAAHHTLTSGIREKLPDVNLQIVGADADVGPEVNSNGTNGDNKKEAIASSQALACPSIAQDKDHEIEFSKRSDNFADLVRLEVPRVLGQARKLSFIRFLQQRKDRLSSRLSFRCL